MKAFQYEDGNLKLIDLDWQHQGNVLSCLPAYGYEPYPSITLGASTDSFSVQVYEDEEEGSKFFVDIETNYCAYFVLVSNFLDLLELLDKLAPIIDLAMRSAERVAKCEVGSGTTERESPGPK